MANFFLIERTALSIMRNVSSPPSIDMEQGNLNGSIPEVLAPHHTDRVVPHPPGVQAKDLLFFPPVTLAALVFLIAEDPIFQIETVVERRSFSRAGRAEDQSFDMFEEMPAAKITIIISGTKLLVDQIPRLPDMGLEESPQRGNTISERAVVVVDSGDLQILINLLIIGGKKVTSSTTPFLVEFLALVFVSLGLSALDDSSGQTSRRHGIGSSY